MVAAAVAAGDCQQQGLQWLLRRRCGRGGAREGAQEAAAAETGRGLGDQAWSGALSRPRQAEAEPCRSRMAQFGTLIGDWGLAEDGEPLPLMTPLASISFPECL